MERTSSSFGKGVLTTAGLLLLPGLLWGGTLLVQHVRVRSAIRACETEWIPATDPKGPPTFPQQRVRVIRAAGCRAIPIILDEVEETPDEQFIRGCSRLLSTFVHKANLEQIEGGNRICWPAYAVGKPELRPQGMIKTREWWKKHVELHHPWWKPWDHTCMAD
jgi:hypothetical protein